MIPVIYISIKYITRHFIGHCNGHVLPVRWSKRFLEHCGVHKSASSDHLELDLEHGYFSGYWPRAWQVEIFVVLLRSVVPCGTATFITGTAASKVG